MEFVELTYYLSLPLMREVAQRAGGRENMKFRHFYSLPQSASLTAPSSEGAFRIGANLFAKLKFERSEKIEA